MTVIIKSPHQFFKYCEFGDNVIGYDSKHTRSVQQEARSLLRLNPDVVFHLVTGLSTIECSECPRRVDEEKPGKRRNPELSPCDPATNPNLFYINEQALSELVVIFGKTEGITAGDYQSYRRSRR